MHHTKAQMEIMRLLASNEETVSKLYRLFAKKFKAERQFWNILSKEELIHASWIKKLFPEVKKGELSFNQDRFKSEIIKNSIDYVTKEIKRFKKEDLSLKDALSVAMDIEITLTESKFFQIYEADSPKLKQLLQALQDAFLGHRAKLEEMLQKTSRA
jgi:rubrerythrin